MIAASMPRRQLKNLILLIIVMAAGGAYVRHRALYVPLEMHGERVEFTIVAGSSLNSAMQAVVQAGVRAPAWALVLVGRTLGRATQIKAGSYVIHQGVTAVGLIDMLTRGDVILGRLTVVEGRTWREIARAIATHPDLKSDIAHLTDAQLAQALGLDAPWLEGRFQPETYLFDKGSSAFELLRRAVLDQQQRLDTIWRARDPALPLKSPDELLVLASIVEKESGQPADRPLIASVFINRLRTGMPLQSDPTVIYGMGERFDGNLRRADLQADTPWNTYTRGGLPPTPIATPGLAALQAASRPPSTAYYYFVARGDGSSEFSANLDAHNRAVEQYQKRAARKGQAQSQ